MKFVKIEAKRVTEKLFTQVSIKKYSPENLDSAYYEVYSYCRIFNNDVDIRLVLDDQVLFDNGEIINYDSKHPLVLINTLVDPETDR